MRNLSFASRVLLLGRPDPATDSGFDPDAAIFFAGIAANAGSLDTTAQSAISDLFAGLKADGVWSSLKLVCPLVGDQLAAAAVAYDPASSSAVTMTCHNFVEGDYSVAGGLQGDGLTKYVDTTCSIPSLTQDSISIGAWALTDSTANGDVHPLIASSYSATGDTNRFYLMGAGSDGGDVGLGTEDAATGSSLPTGDGWYLQSYNGTIHSGYRGETLEFGRTVPDLIWQQAGIVFVLASGNLVSDARIGFAIIADYLISAKNTFLVARILNFYNAISRS